MIWSIAEIRKFHERWSTPRQIALERIQYNGLMARVVVEQLVKIFQEFCDSCLIHQQLCPNTNDLDKKAVFAIKCLIEMLECFTTLASKDNVLADELLYELRTHTGIVSKMVAIVDNNILDDDHSMCDYFCSLQDLVCEVSFYSKSNRSLVSPTDDELRRRLPLTFAISTLYKDIHSKYFNILIGQVQTRQSAQDDVGFVMWPSAVVLANYIASNPDIVRGKEVIELGAGCGLTGISAGAPNLGRAKSVTLTDFNDIVLKNLENNIGMNGLNNICKVDKLNFYNQKGNNAKGWINGAGETCRPFDIVVAADIICKPDDAIAAAKTCHDVLAIDGKALIICGDSAHRFGVDIFADECRKVGLLVTVTKIDRRELISSSQNLESTSGYVEGMLLNFFTLTKNRVTQI